MEIDEYFYDDGTDNGDHDDVERLSDIIARRTPRRGSKNTGRNYIRFGRNSGAGIAKVANIRFVRDQLPLNGYAEKRARYVRFGRAGNELGIHDDVEGLGNDRLNTADKRPNYVRFG